MNEENKKAVGIPKAQWLAFLVLVLIAAASFLGYRAVSDRKGLLKVYFLDVGQGDAVLIESPNGNQVLIDGGPDNKVVEEIGKVMPFFDRSIDALVLSHTDSDHLTGLISVLDRYSVGEILETGVRCVTSLCDEWHKEESVKKVEDETVERGMTVDIGGGAKLVVLYPFENQKDAPVSSTNNSSAVLRLEYGKQSVLFPGDIGSQVEDKLIASHASLSSDFLKVAHHGSKTSTSERFLNAVKPKAAFIEVGENNRYNLPSQIILDRLAQNHIPYYRTDKNGLIELTLDGENYSIKSIK
ncbi:MAG: competence protein ComEC [Parcubacteria group bacterium Licking1014_17]|nr:MAG: competence protein ComEC [Parcubacteria group bacterium Licking1014_17]